jgi:hypothetical protein
MGCVPNCLTAAYGNIALFGVYRPFYYTCISDYVAKVFGFQTFGKVYGLIICLAGLGNFAQAGLDSLTYEVFDRNPIPVNSFLTLSTCVVGTALSLFVWREARIMAANRCIERELRRDPPQSSSEGLSNSFVNATAESD